MRVFQNENLVEKIGGRLQDDYLHLRGIVLSINENYFPYLKRLGFYQPGDLEEVLDILLSDLVLTAAKKAYVKRLMGRIEDGSLRIERVLSSRTLARAEADPDKRDNIITAELKRKFGQKYREIEQTYCPSSGYRKKPLEICREALLLTPQGLAIDVPKFIEVYGSFLEASQSELWKQHQEACNAINTFFGGLEVTQKELERYFRIEDGILVPNPRSVNGEGYLRLGYRGEIKINKY